MAKIAVFIILAIVIATIGFIAISICLTWIKHLWDADREAVRNETREAKLAREDLADAVARQNRRKKS